MVSAARNTLEGHLSLPSLRERAGIKTDEVRSLGHLNQTDIHIHTYTHAYIYINVSDLGS